MSTLRDASTPIKGVSRDATRTSAAAILSFVAYELVPPEIAPHVATLTLIVLSAVLAGLGKLAREKGWAIIGAVI